MNNNKEIKLSFVVPQNSELLSKHDDDDVVIRMHLINNFPLRLSESQEIFLLSLSLHCHLIAFTYIALQYTHTSSFVLAMEFILDQYLLEYPSVNNRLKFDRIFISVCQLNLLDVSHIVIREHVDMYLKIADRQTNRQTGDDDERVNERNKRRRRSRCNILVRQYFLYLC